MPYFLMQADILSGPAGSKPMFTSKGFIPGESIVLWYNKPDGGAIAIGTIEAHADGTTSATFDTTGLLKGGYTLVMHGNWSAITSVGTFEVQ